MLDRFMRQKQNDAAIEVCIEEKKKKLYADGRERTIDVGLYQPTKRLKLPTGLMGEATQG